jgi:hypothetical protein
MRTNTGKAATVSEAKYILFPGEVWDTDTGEDRFVGYDELIDLYGLSKDECMEFSTEKGITEFPPKALLLGPLYNGNYRGFLKMASEAIE